VLCLVVFQGQSVWVRLEPFPDWLCTEFATVHVHSLFTIFLSGKAQYPAALCQAQAHDTPGEILNGIAILRALSQAPHRASSAVDTLDVASTSRGGRYRVPTTRYCDMREQGSLPASRSSCRRRCCTSRTRHAGRARQRRPRSQLAAPPWTAPCTTDTSRTCCSPYIHI
jgi:hypothetical protein